MERRTALATMSTLLLMSASILAFNVQPAEASETIYIRANGSVDPPTAPIQRDGDLYTFTDNIYDDIVVEKDNIVIDGAGYTLEGTGEGTGINLTRRNRVTIKNMEIRAFDYAIWLKDSSSNSIYGNNITTNQYDYASIWLDNSLTNDIYGNNMTYNHACVELEYSSGNNIHGNHMVFNTHCITLSHSSNNNVSGNNMMDNTIGIELEFSSDNNIYENDITNHYYGIWLKFSSDNNNICRNNITANDNDIGFEVASNNLVYHNNFVDSNIQVVNYYSINVWDDGHPSGGNFWSDYTGMDFYWGAYQNETGSDGIGDMPYVIDDNNRDHYPLMSNYEYWSNPIFGDINKNMGVDSDDLSQVATTYGSSSETPNWNPNCDINRDDKVDVFDLFNLSKNYGETVCRWQKPTQLRKPHESQPLGYPCFSSRLESW
jgi:parallel beta-helix repeat protein